MPRTLTAEERAWCAALGLETGIDDDDEDKHQFQHICWPYAAYEGTLCHSPRLWGHGNRFSADPSPYARADEVDCPACFTALDLLRSVDPVLLAVIARLTDAVDSLTEVETAARGRLDALTRAPDYVKAVAAGYPEVDAAALRRALDRDASRHLRHATEYGKRRDERRSR